MIISGETLSIYDVYDAAVNRTPVTLDPDQLDRVRRAHAHVQAWGMERQPIYGVNTGFGELAHMIIPPDRKTEHQENLIRTHAAGSGRPFNDDVVRAIMTARLNCLMKGHSGVSNKA